MKKLIIVFIASAFVVACNSSNKNDSTPISKVDSTHSWSQKELDLFMTQCNIVAKEFTNEESEAYCECIKNLIVGVHPDPKAAGQLQDHEWRDLLENSDCNKRFSIPKIENKWTDLVVGSFMSGCMESALEKYDNEQDALAFCECALEETKRIIPNPHFAIMLTTEEYNQISESCKLEDQ